jgi:hypothetical protein
MELAGTSLKLNDFSNNMVLLDSQGAGFNTLVDIIGKTKLVVNDVHSNFLKVMLPVERNSFGLSIHTSADSAQAEVTNINNNYIELAISEKPHSDFDTGLKILMEGTTGNLSITNILNNHIILNSINSISTEFAGAAGMYFGSEQGKSSPNKQTINIAHIKGNRIEATLLNPSSDKQTSLAGIYILTRSLDNQPLDNVFLTVDDLSHNWITIHSNAVLEVTRGISVNTQGPGYIKNTLNNRIELDTPKAQTAMGISYLTSNRFSVQNTSFNDLNVRGSGLVYGIRAQNYGASSATFSGFNYNRILVNGPASSTRGLYFAAATNANSSLTVSGIQGNSLFLSPHAVGIFAFAEQTTNSVTLIADPNNPVISPSAANGGTSYATGGMGMVTPSA